MRRQFRRVLVLPPKLTLLLERQPLVDQESTVLKELQALPRS
jgi:hypothetical protein